MERGIDEEKPIGNLRFHELMAEVKRATVKIPKTSTLSALNDTRRTVKHYGQLADPVTVRTYLEASRLAIDTVLVAVAGKQLQDVSLDELLKDGEAKEFLREASRAVEGGLYQDALLAIRRAIFVEVEAEYAIDEWRESDGTEALTLGVLMRRGRKAPYFARNRVYIEKHVTFPCDYVVLDQDTVRLDLVEWGVPTQDFFNLRRLTPDVFRFARRPEWFYSMEPGDVATVPSESVVRYCIDRAVSLISRKQRHQHLVRALPSSFNRMAARVVLDTEMLSKPTAAAFTKRTCKVGDLFAVLRVADGEDGIRYVQVWDQGEEVGISVSYLPLASVAIEAVVADLRLQEP
jgi:hypothetical protein